MDLHDHRLLGPRLELFHQQEDAPGTVFWHPRGAVLYGLIEGYIRRQMQRHGFREVRTPQLLSRSLWERSGHWSKYADNMFTFADGPKLEFILRDRDGREWQCGTIQVDLVLPERLDIEVVTAGGARVRPVMLHHAVLGSIERFTAVLLEHHRGALPFWLAPDQILVAPITAEQQQYAGDVADAFTAAGLRCMNADARETLARRIAAAHERNIPIVAIAGATEAAAGSISLRERGGRRAIVSLAQAVQQLATQAAH